MTSQQPDEQQPLPGFDRPGSEAQARRQHSPAPSKWDASRELKLSPPKLIGATLFLLAFGAFGVFCLYQAVGLAQDWASPEALDPVEWWAPLLFVGFGFGSLTAAWMSLQVLRGRMSWEDFEDFLGHP